MIDHKAEMAREGVLSAPPALVAGLTLLGVSLQDWVLILTICWLLFQISYFIYQRYKDWNNDDD